MANPIDKIDAVRALYGRDSYDQCHDDGTVKWKDGHETTNAETTAINAEVIRLQAEYDSQQYARDRKVEYNALNQFEMQYDDEEDGTTTWKDAIAAIKTKYPKG